MPPPVTMLRNIATVTSALVLLKIKKETLFLDSQKLTADIFFVVRRSPAMCAQHCGSAGLEIYRVGIDEHARR